VSYLAWTWDTWGCDDGSPVLISSYTGTPCTGFGIGYQDHLLSLLATPPPTADPTATASPTPTTTPTSSPTPRPSPDPSPTATATPTSSATPDPGPAPTPGSSTTQNPRHQHRSGRPTATPKSTIAAPGGAFPTVGPGDSSVTAAALTTGGNGETGPPIVGLLAGGLLALLVALVAWRWRGALGHKSVGPRPSLH
jgi:hypothetical protein